MRRNTTPSMSTAPVLRDAIISAVATLDQSDGSRVSLIESIDNARKTLSEVMPDDFDELVTEFIESETDEDEDDDDNYDGDDGDDDNYDDDDDE